MKPRTDRTEAPPGRGSGGAGAQWKVAAAVAVVATVVAVAAVRAFRPGGARNEGVVTLAQIRSAPGRPPLLLRTYAVSNGLRRPIVFDMPDPCSTTMRIATFCTNGLFRLPDGGWARQDYVPFRERTTRRIRVPPGGVAEFTVELPDDRRPRALILPVQETGFRGRQRFCAAFPPELPDPLVPCQPNGRGGFDITMLRMETRDPRFEKPLRRIECVIPGRYSYRGKEYSFKQLRSILNKERAMPASMLLDIPDTFPAREWFRMRDLCAGSGIVSLMISTDGAAVPISNAMGNAWRLGPEEDPPDLPGRPPPPPDPFRPGRLVIREDGSFVVDNLDCPAFDLHQRISDATDGGTRTLLISCDRNAPYGALRSVIGAFWDIGGIFFWLWME